jgi:hypothetical protein
LPTRQFATAIAFSELIYSEASLLSRRDHQGAHTFEYRQKGHSRSENAVTSALPVTREEFNDECFGDDAQVDDMRNRVRAPRFSTLILTMTSGSPVVRAVQRLRTARFHENS